MNNTLSIENLASWLFGILALFIGVVNTFWGNDPQFGILVLLLTIVYFVPVNSIIQKITGFSIPRFGLLKALLAMFILVAALGVGELFSKIELMQSSF